MTQANDGVLVSPSGSGTNIATHLVNSKEYQVMMEADIDGHIRGSAPAYLFSQTPRVTTAAATDFFDIFNATGSGKIGRIDGIWSIVNVTAISGIIPSFQFDFFRTSAIGTGGTAHTFEGATSPAAGLISITRASTTKAGTLSASITSRALPTGGATASAFLFSAWLMSEDSNAAPYLMQGINLIPVLPGNASFELQENQGFKCRQITATASTGTNFGWLIALSVIP